MPQPFKLAACQLTVRNGNGGEVMERVRSIKDVALFARPVASRLPAGTKFDPLTGAAKKPLIKRLLKKKA